MLKHSIPCDCTTVAKCALSQLPSSPLFAKHLRGSAGISRGLVPARLRHLTHWEVLNSSAVFTMNLVAPLRVQSLVFEVFRRAVVEIRWGANNAPLRTTSHDSACITEEATSREPKRGSAFIATTLVTAAPPSRLFATDCPGWRGVARICSFGVPCAGHSSLLQSSFFLRACEHSIG
jgi:hypothetical protein